MPAPPTSADSARLLSCTPGRVVLRTFDHVAGRDVVCKLLERGSLAEAEREVAFARAAPAGATIEHLRAATDPATGLACVVTAYVDAPNLAALVGARGPLTAKAACALFAPLARALAALHEGGICHGDVTPTNVLATDAGARLIDFEHAARLGEPSRPGTPDFAAPEAGAAPAAGSLDVYALGTTLRYCLAGDPRTRWRLPRELHALLRDCTATAAELRPDAAAVADRLEALAAVQDLDPNGMLAERRERVARLMPDLQAIGRLERDDDPAAAHAALRRVRCALRAHPRDGALLAQRRNLLVAIAAMLGRAANDVGEAARAETFAAAIDRLAQLTAAVDLARRQPGGLPLPQPTDARRPERLQRDPLGFLAALSQRLAQQRDDLAAAERTIDDAERALDLAGAERRLGALAAERGGASPAAIRRRDQLHRLAFFLDRIGRAEENASRLAQLWDATALQPLVEFAARCAAAVGNESRESSAAAVGLRNLSVTLTNLVEEFPHLAEPAMPAREALDAALRHTTELAWTAIDQTERMLEAVPVPVRPIQLAIARLDALRILEALVDQPDRPRSVLLDAIERLRLNWEEARATRDRLTMSAERAIARGHWTTGLFDMERAVASLGEAEAPEAKALNRRLAEVLRRKQEIEAAVRRNVELAGRYQALLDDETGDFGTRLQTLAERRDSLQFLILHVPEDRASLYARDLRDVEIQLALERAALAESQFDHTIDLEARLQLARRTVQQIEDSLRGTPAPEMPPGRLVRAAEHWRRVVADCDSAIAQRRESARRQRARRRQATWGFALAGAGLVVTALALDWLPGPWRDRPVHAARRDAREATFDRIAADPHATLLRARAEPSPLPAYAAMHRQHLVEAFLTRPGADGLRFAAAELEGVAGEALATATAAATVTELVTAAVCRAAAHAGDDDCRAAAAALVAAAERRGLWEGLPTEVLAARCFGATPPK